MKKTGAALARFALEQLGVSHTFGIPGVHNTELYDELNASPHIQPVLVAHECGAAFMADAFSRTGQRIGTLVIVPAAGVTHAASGIGVVDLVSIVDGASHLRSLGSPRKIEKDRERLSRCSSAGRWAAHNARSHPSTFCPVSPCGAVAAPLPQHR